MKRIPAQSRESFQSGMVSIMVTMVLMMVISLIVIGFAQVARREQRQSLDRQLSTQAFFAAESGINDAHSAIVAALKGGTSIQDKTTCPTTTGGGGGNAYKFDPLIDAAHNVSYSCLLVSTDLPDIKVDIPGDGSSVVLPIHPKTGTINRLHFTWTTTSTAPVTNCAGAVGSQEFPKSGLASWRCPYGVLRLDLVPTNVLNRNQLLAGEMSTFLYPTRGGSTTVAYGTKGAVAAMHCDASSCTGDITGLQAGGNQYSLRASAVYAGGNLTITGFSPSNAPVTFVDAQARVDATGKAQDVLRRVQVRFSLAAQGNLQYSNYGLTSGSSICKRFMVAPNQFNVPADITGQDQDNPLCRGQVN